MKASWLAFAFLVSVGPACAGETASPVHAVKIGETPISRMYRVAWLAKFGRQQTAIEAAQAPTRSEINAPPDAANVALASASEAKLTAAARVQVIAAQVDDEMRALAAGRPLKYRLHVDCSSKFVAAARPSQGPAPTLLAAFGSDVENVRISVDSCTVKVLWKFLDQEQQSPHMRAYSVSLPLAPSTN